MEVALMGRDVRNANGVRYPVWIDCTYFAVNGKTIFSDTKTVCHDKRYIYRKAVKDGEEVMLEMAWSECQSSNVLDEYRQLQSDLKDANSKASATEVALKKANDKVSATETALKNANDKVRLTETALEKAGNKVIATEAALKDAKTEIVKSNQERQNIANNLDKEKQKNAKLERELNNVKNGWSFKIGRVITWLPRKIRNKF